MKAIKTILITLIFTLLITHQTIASQITLTPEKELEYQLIVLEEVNKYRSSIGLSALNIDTLISKEARQHSLDMANKKLAFGHQGFDQRIAHIKNKITSFGGGAENIACFKLPPQQVVKKWLTSRGHKKNIKGQYNRTGIGIVQGKKGWLYYTQIFVKDNQG